ncbi:MAG: M23 family metallopeptidase [Hyphomonadaceae bacterium]|nr:M23 family metallopeptidase [Hyphomonadaceae bacterium]
MTLLQNTAWAVLLAGALLVGAVVRAAPERAEASPVVEQRQEAQKIRRRSAVITSPQLIVPVSNVALPALTDTWGATRAEGRTHEGIDIMAPAGTPVRAAADGRIVKFFDSERGGVTIYQFDTSERFVYYYAHLSRRAAGLAEGDVVHQGDVIAYVGMSGNAPVPHLHFEIQRLTPERHWWEAESMNPYPLLVAGRAPN